MTAAERVLASLIAEGATAAMERLSLMLGQRIEADDVRVSAETGETLDDAERDPSLALSVEGGAGGCLVLVYTPATAAAFVDLLTLQPAGTTASMGAMERSTLHALGRLLGTELCGVLNARVDPGVAAWALAAADATSYPGMLQIFTVETTFRAPGRKIAATFLLFASPSLLEALVERRRAA